MSDAHTVHQLAYLTPAQPHGITRMVQGTGRKYVRCINTTHRRTASLWEGRFKASLVDSEAYPLTCMRYIELNPVRAAMVAHPGDYLRSSYAHNGLGKADSLTTPHALYGALGKNAEEVRHAYRELFPHQFGPSEVHAIREAPNQEVVLGREDFKGKIEAMTRKRTRPGQPGRPRIEEPQASRWWGR